MNLIESANIYSTSPLYNSYLPSLEDINFNCRLFKYHVLQLDQFKHPTHIQSKIRLTLSEIITFNI